MSDLQYTQISWDAELAIVTIDRQEKLNALNGEVIAELGEAFDRFRYDDKVLGVILTGAGEKAFVAGADIGELAKMDALSGVQVSRAGQGVFRSIERFPKPVLAAVGGFALGGGLELAMGCDFRIASSKAKFGQPEVNLGLIPGYAATQRLPRLVGMGDALYLLMTADMIGAEDALRMGLVQKVVEPETLHDTVMAIANNIISKGPKAVSIVKRVVRQGMLQGFVKGSSLEAELFGTLFKDEGEKGMRAFLEKRKPEW